MKGLFVILGQQVKCFFLDKLDSVVELDDIIYKEADNQAYSGFYDWLREDTNTIIGLRCYRFDGFDPDLSKALDELPFVKFVKEKVIEVYFASKRSFREDISNDQDFGACKLYSGDTGYAILLDIEYLTTGERSSIPIGNVDKND